MIPKFRLVVLNGKSITLIFEELRDYFKLLSDGDYFVIIKSAKQHEIRSNEQNKYMWGVVYKLIAEHTGYTIEEVHEICKAKFNYLMRNIGSEWISIARSTTDLRTNEMEKYLSDIRQWASLELSVYIPLPNEVEIS